MNTVAPTRTAPAAASRGRSRLARRLVAVLVPVVVLFGSTVVGAAPASAATWFNYGSNGLAYTYPTAYGQYVMQTTNGFTSQMRGVRVPGMVLGRSPASAGAQAVNYSLTIDRWYPSRNNWVQVQTGGAWRLPLTGAKTAMPTYWMQLGEPGHYRVNVTIGWYDASGRYLGARVYILNSAGDYGCNIAACRVGPGYLSL